MAVTAAPRRVAPPTAPAGPSANGHAPRVRLHSEILPPEIGPPTPVTMRATKRALAILAAGIVIVQLVSAPVGHKLNAIARTDTDVYSVWNAYLAAPVPDVLVVGASPARTDIDVPALAAAMSAAAGHAVTVGKMGFAGQPPAFIDALMYRVMKRAPHPKLVVFVQLGPELNSGCLPCSSTVNGGLWDITDFSDPDFMKLALHESPSPQGLVLGWTVPVFAYYPSLIAVQCLAFKYGRSAALSTAGAIPRQLQNPTACETTVPYKWPGQAPMDPLDFQGSVDNFHQFMNGFTVSQTMVDSVTDMVNRARAGGANVAFLETPVHPGLRGKYPKLVDEASAEVQALGKLLNVDVIDMRTAVSGDPDMWVDALHLNKPGADLLAPQLSQAFLAASAP